METTPHELKKLDQYKNQKIKENPIYIEYSKEIIKTLSSLTDINEKVTYLNEVLIDLLENKALHDGEEKETQNIWVLNDDPLNTLISFVKEKLSIYEEILSKSDLTKSTLEKKIKSNAPPALLAHVFHELALKGYIEFPMYAGEINLTGLARHVFEVVEIDTTLNNFIKEMNPGKNTLSLTKRQKFNLREIKDLD
jgi:hypothetical protein